MAKKPVKKNVIPQEILTKLKRVKTKFFKEDTLKVVKEAYLEIYKEDKLEHKNKKWSNLIFHKRALTKLKNRKKSEKLGGAIDKYYMIVFGASNVRDLSQNRRNNIIDLWDADPQKAMSDGLIMFIKETNPKTGEIEKVPILDDTGGIIPRDNVEFGKRKNGTKFKNPNHDHAIAHAYRRNVIGACSNLQGVKGVFIHELRDKSATDLDIPMNTLVKSSGKTLGTEVITLDKNIYIDRELLEEMITNLEDDIEQGIITEEYANEMKKHYINLLLITKKKKKEEDDEEEEEDEVKHEEIETTLFKLRSTKGTAFIKVENEKEFEIADFPMRDHMQPNINLIYKKYFYPFTSDCSNLLNYHEDHRFIDGDPEQINWDEFVSLQDVNLIQINMEASIAGNYTLFVEDESLFNKDIIHLDEDIDAIKLLVPSHVDLNFAQDSKLNIIGSPVQFQAQDDERKELWETKLNEEGEPELDKNGKEIKIPVFAFPIIMIQGIFPIPEYMIKVDTLDLTLDDEVNVDTIFEDSDKKPKVSDEIEEIPEVIDELEKLEKEVESEIIEKKPAKKTTKKPIEETEETEEISDEDEFEDKEIW